MLFLPSDYFYVPCNCSLCQQCKDRKSKCNAFYNSSHGLVATGYFNWERAFHGNRKGHLIFILQECPSLWNPGRPLIRIPKTPGIAASDIVLI